jgi:purine nucleosidase
VKDATLTRDELAPILALGTPLSEFYLAVNAAVWEFVKREHGVDGISHPDAVMIAMALDPSVIVDSKMCFVDVESDSELTRGYSLVDMMGVVGREVDNGVKVKELMNVARSEPNADVVLNADKERFTKMLVSVLQGS